MEKIDHLNVYRNPRGWVEFWLGLMVLLFLAGFFGRIHYLESQTEDYITETAKEKPGAK